MNPVHPVSRSGFATPATRSAPTTTITEIVRSAAGRGQRIIVCSQNNRAVDNVLGRLSGELDEPETTRQRPENSRRILGRNGVTSGQDMFGRWL